MSEIGSAVSSSSTDSGYATVTAKPVKLSSLNSVEKLENELSETLEKNKQLEEEMEGYRRQVVDYKRTISNMRAGHKAAKNPKDFNARQAKKTNDKLRKEIEALQRTIEQHENTIAALKQKKKGK